MSAPLLSLLIAASSPAFPCVALVHEAGELAESEGQETIFWKDEATGDAVVEYLVRYDGTADSFGWIIAIPGPFSGLWDGDEGHFDAIRDATAPDVWYTSVDDEQDNGGGCRRSRGKNLEDGAGGFGDTGEANQGGVDVVAEGFSGSYAYTAVESQDAAALQTWLDTNGWDAGNTDAALAAYVEDGFSFVLVELLPSTGDTPDQGRALPPIAIQYGGGELTFPARMASGFGNQVFRSTVWVVGAHSAQVQGWTSTQNDWIEGDGDANVLWESTLMEAGGDEAGYFKAFAGEISFHDDFDSAWVTRFDTLAEGDAHTVDATFTLDGDDVAVTTTLSVWSDDGASGAGGVLLPMLALMGLGAANRRRR